MLNGFENTICGTDISSATAKCELCGFRAHFLGTHIRREHGLSDEEYLAKFPGSALRSELGIALIRFKTRQANNKLIDFDIVKTFGIKGDGNIKTVSGFEHPHPLTPAIDPDYSFRKEILSTILYAIENDNERVLLTGHTGTGKSSIVEQVYAQLNRPLYRVNFDGDITRADFVGQWVLRGEEMTFQYGILPNAMKEGAGLLLDEWDCANPSVGMVLQAVLEGKPLTITENGEIVKPAPGFKIFATSNTLGMGDNSGLYNGTQPQNYAQMDRFTIVEIVDYPSRSEEKSILEKKCGLTDAGLSGRTGREVKPGTTADIIDKILKVGALVREAFMKEEIMVTMSTRTLVNIGNKLTAFGDVRRAYAVAFVNKLNADDRNFVNEVVQRVWG